MQSKKFKNFIYIAIFLMFLAIFISDRNVLAVLEVNLKNSPPCLLTDKFGACQDVSTLEGYINLIFRFALGIGGFLAVLMIVIGGILITVSGSIDKTKEGKDYIQSALLGLALLLGTYVFLKTVNPGLVILTPPSAPEIKLIPPEPSQTTVNDYVKSYPELCKEEKVPRDISEQPAINQYNYMFPSSYYKTVVTTTQKAIDSHRSNMDRISAYGINLSSSGNCTDLCNEKCTSLAAMPERAIDFIIDLKKKVGDSCEITITGGTEVGHQTHRPYKPIFDLRETECLGNYILNNAATLAQMGLKYVNITSKIDGKYSYRERDSRDGTIKVKGLCSKLESVGIKCDKKENVDHFHMELM